jgi:hypothetical protein
VTNKPIPSDVQIVAKFSVWKLLFLCGFIIALAAVCWTQIPSLIDYQGRRYSTEFGRFLLLSATGIATMFLPLAAWHAWNFFTRPGALYVSGGRLFLYWAFFRSVPVEDIADAVDLGRAGPLGDSVRLSLNGRRDVMFQTTFMAKSGGDVVAAIKGIAAVRT